MMHPIKVKPFVCSSVSFAALFLAIFAQALAQGGRFAIQLGASPERAEAEATLKAAQAQNLDAYLVKSNVPGKGIFYRVRVGNYPSRAAAEKAAQQFKASGALGEYLIAAYETPLAPAARAPMGTGNVVPTPTPARATANPAAGAQAAATVAQQNVTLTSSSFAAKGLNNETVLTRFYLGDFVNVPFDRDDLNFVTLYEAYLNSYARRCSAYLPANKVEMTRQECATERVTRNGYGTVVNRSCVEWVSVGTGLYADPEMYDALRKLYLIQAGDAWRNITRVMTMMSQQGAGGMMNMVGDVQAVMSDMNALVQLNACANPGLKRFQENLRLFALNRQPLRLGAEAATSSAVTPPPGVPFRDQNYSKLVEDLIYEQSKTWVMNRFISGSVGVSVASRDDKGRPSKLAAEYLFNGFNGRSRGVVSLTFTDGLPECMYFFDFPATCRTPNRKIVAAYANGDYQE